MTASVRCLPVPGQQLIASAKLNDVDPQAWLADVLACIPAKPNPVAVEAISRVNNYAKAAGCTMDRRPLGLCVVVKDKSDPHIADDIGVLRDMGATDIHGRFSSASPDDVDSKQTAYQIDAFKRFRDIIDRVHG